MWFRNSYLIVEIFTDCWKRIHTSGDRLCHRNKYKSDSWFSTSACHTVDDEWKSAKCWRWHSLYWHPQQTTNAEVSVLSLQTSCRIIYCASNIILPAEQGQFDVSYPVPSIPGFLCHHSFLCYWFKICNPEWSDVPLCCASLVYWGSGIKSTLLVTYFVSLLQPYDLTCKTVCSVQILSFLPECFPSVPQQQLDTLQAQSHHLFRNLEKILQTGVQSRLWPRTKLLLPASLEL